MRHVHMKPIHSTASKCSQLQVITWLCAWHISIEPQTVQQNGHIRANKNSLTWSNARVTGAKSVQTGLFSSSMDHWCSCSKTLISPSMHSTIVEPSKIFVLPSRECPGMLMKGVTVLHSNAHPHVACTIQDTPCSMHWTVLDHPPYSPDLSPCHFHMKIIIYWDIAPCSLVEINQCFRGAYCLHHQGNDGGSKHLWNIGKFLWDYMAQHPRRQSSSYSMPW
jgi:hypothetical protein